MNISMNRAIKNIATKLAGKENIAMNEEFPEEFFETVMDTPYDLTEQLDNVIAVATFQDLPLRGAVDKIYKTMCDCALWTWNSQFETYDEYNPYEGNNTLVDPSAHMPFGGAPNMQFLYNLWALKADLKFLNKHNLKPIDMLARRHRDAENINRKFIEVCHSALYQQILKFAVKNNQLSPALEGLVHQQGGVVWYDTNTHELGFDIPYEELKSFKFIMKM